MIEFIPDFIRDKDESGASNSTRSLKPNEAYLRFIVIKQGQLLSVCDQMRYATEFLSGYRASLHLPKAGITRLDYIIYHIENHFVRVAMVNDRALQLVNLVFRLGIPERECRFSVVALNDHVRNSSIFKVLSKLHKETKEYRAQRNAVVHRETYSDDGIEDISIFDHLEKHHPDKAYRFRDFYKMMMDRYIDESKNRMRQDNKRVFTLVGQLFDELTNTFEHNYLILSE